MITFARQLLASIGLGKPAVKPVTHELTKLPGCHIIMITGLDNAGKSTLLVDHICTSKEDRSIISKIIYPDIKTCSYHNITFKVLDIGLSQPASFRRRERQQFSEASALVWIIDTTDDDRIVEAREELIRTALRDDGKPVLILANKNDLDGAWTVEQTSKYFVDDISPHYVNKPNAVFVTNMKTGEGLKQAFGWLRKTMEGCVKFDGDITAETPVLSEKAVLNG